MIHNAGKSLLFISMLGEDDLFNPEDFESLCSSGQEKDWFGPAAHETGFSLSGVDICRGDALPAVDDDGLGNLGPSIAHVHAMGPGECVQQAIAIAILDMSARFARHDTVGHIPARKFCQMAEG